MKCPRFISVYAGIFQATVGLILVIVGYAAPSWYDYDSITFGLWKYCVSGECDDLPDNLESDSFKAAKGMGIIGIVAGAVSVGLGVVFLMKKHTRLLDFGLLAGVVAFAFVLIEFVLIVEDVDRSDYGYCFGFTLSGFLQLFFGPLQYWYAKCKLGSGQLD